MTKMVIDNRATAKRAYECYSIDRNEYKTVADLEDLVYECLNKEVYSITVYENDVQIIKVLNTRA